MAVGDIQSRSTTSHHYSPSVVSKDNCKVNSVTTHPMVYKLSIKDFQAEVVYLVGSAIDSLAADQYFFKIMILMKFWGEENPFKQVLCHPSVSNCGSYSISLLQCVSTMQL